MNERTVINSPPISVTAHSGIDSQNPQFSMASMMLCGSTVDYEFDTPDAVIIFETTPCTMDIKLINSSSP